MPSIVFQSYAVLILVAIVFVFLNVYDVVNEALTPNIVDRRCSLHSGTKQIKNMTDYERCSLFELIKFLCSTSA